MIDCRAGEREHHIAQESLPTHPIGVDLFLILVALSSALVWEVKLGSDGKIAKLIKKQAYVNHYHFHIIDRDWCPWVHLLVHYDATWDGREQGARHSGLDCAYLAEPAADQSGRRHPAA